MLKAQLKAVEGPKIIIWPHTKERVELMANATTHGSKWMVTGDSHLMTKDFFISVKVPHRKNKIKAMEMNKSDQITKVSL